jgi:hypothetical protein
MVWDELKKWIQKKVRKWITFTVNGALDTDSFQARLHEEYAVIVKPTFSEGPS